MKVDYNSFKTGQAPKADTKASVKKYFDKEGKEIKKTKKTQDDIMAYQEKGFFFVRTDSRRNLVKPHDVEYLADAEKHAKLAGTAVYQSIAVEHAIFHAYVRYLQERNNLFYVQAQRAILAKETNSKGSVVFTEEDSTISQFSMDKAKEAKKSK